MSTNVAIQGIKASFHDVAARRYFAQKNITAIECATFRDLCERLKDNQAEFAVMAIENSIAGSILPNYSLLETYDFKIIGEIYLRIEMAIMALPGQKITDLQFVQSHPMALIQCDEFLNKYPNIKILEATDTAESAKDIRDKKLKGYGAIASQMAADTYSLEVLKFGIETNKQNYTRFLVIGKEAVNNLDANKTSLRFQTHHAPGCLVNVLKIFEDFRLNMTKIQSVPIPGKPSEYSFHVDLEWSDSMAHGAAMEKIKTVAANIIQFGDYPRGQQPWK